jgi:hypothetical protein
MKVKRTLLLAGWMLSGSALWAADQIEPLDGDFLDYLGDMESDDDNWTLLDGADASSANQDSESPDRAKKPSLPKPSQEAAKPAVEQR